MNQDHVAVVHVDNCKIIEGHNKIVHEINITKISQTVKDVKTEILLRQGDNDEIISILKRKVLELETNLRRLQPTHKHRTKRWDALGRAWKWMSGSPDADDLKIINNDIEKFTENNNQQIVINDNFYQEIDNITDSINKLISIDNRTSTAIDKEYDLLNIILNLEILNDEVANIQNSILLSKIKLINSRILSTDEIAFISQTFSNQGIPSAFLDEALGFATSTIGTNGDIILYIINIPHLGNQTYRHLRIEPIIANSKRIKLEGNDFIYGNGKLFLRNNPCRQLSNWSLCELSDLKDMTEDNCILKIITGQNSKCNYEQILHHEVATEMGPNTLLLNEVNDTLRNTCGIADRFLLGSFLITYQNCSVSIRNRTFTNQVIKIVQQPIYLPSIGLNVTQNRIEYPTDIHTLTKLHHNNLQHLENLQQTSWNQFWTIIGGLSSSSAIIFVFVIYVLFRMKRQATTVVINESMVPVVKEDRSTRVYQPPSLKT